MRWHYKAPVRGPFPTDLYLSRQAQRHASKLSITDAEIADTLQHGKKRHRGVVLFIEHRTIRLEIFRPRNKNADLVSAIRRVIQPTRRTLWDHVMEVE